MLGAVLGGLALDAEWQLISILDRKRSAQYQQIKSMYWALRGNGIFLAYE